MGSKDPFFLRLTPYRPILAVSNIDRLIFPCIARSEKSMAKCVLNSGQYCRANTSGYFVIFITHRLRVCAENLRTSVTYYACGFRAEAARRWFDNRGATMPFFSVRPPCGARVGIVRCHLRHVYRLQTYDFSNLYNFPLNKIVEAAEPVQKSHSRFLPPHGGLAEAARKGGYEQDTGSIDPSQDKCELGISDQNYGRFHHRLNAPNLSPFV